MRPVLFCPRCDSKMVVTQHGLTMRMVCVACKLAQGDKQP